MLIRPSRPAEMSTDLLFSRSFSIEADYGGLKKVSEATRPGRDGVGPLLDGAAGGGGGAEEIS